jgi:uncharacterized protein (TIGR03086 family)
MTSPTPTSMTPSRVAEIAARYRRLADAFDAKLAAVTDAQWSAPTPCSGWDVRALVRHVVDVHGMMIAPVGRTLRPAPSVDDDPVAALRSARADVEAVLDDPAVASTEFDGAFGRSVVADVIDRFLGVDLVVHGWDLARATGQDEAIPAEEVDRVLAFIDQIGPETMRRHGAVGPEVPTPPDATPQQRMLGLLGRDPS